MSRELGTVQWHAAGGGSQSSRNYNGNQQNNQNWQGPAGWTPEMDQGLREPWTEEEFRAAEAVDRRQGHCAADYEDCYSSVCCATMEYGCYKQPTQMYAQCRPFTFGKCRSTEEWLCPDHWLACAREGTNCIEKRCCQNPALTCYHKEDNYAQCAESCEPNMRLEGDYGPASTWTCKELSMPPPPPVPPPSRPPPPPSRPRRRRPNAPPPPAPRAQPLAAARPANAGRAAAGASAAMPEWWCRWADESRPPLREFDHAASVRGPTLRTSTTSRAGRRPLAVRVARRGLRGGQDGLPHLGRAPAPLRAGGGTAPPARRPRRGRRPCVAGGRRAAAGGAFAELLLSAVAPALPALRVQRRRPEAKKPAQLRAAQEDADAEEEEEEEGDEDDDEEDEYEYDHEEESDAYESDRHARRGRNRHGHRRGSSRGGRHRRDRDVEAPTMRDHDAED